MGMFIISPYDKGGMLYKPSQKYAAACGDLHPSEYHLQYVLCCKVPMWWRPVP